MLLCYCATACCCVLCATYTTTVFFLPFNVNPLTHYPLPTTHYPLPITHYPLPYLPAIAQWTNQSTPRRVEGHPKGFCIHSHMNIQQIPTAITHLVDYLIPRVQSRVLLTERFLLEFHTYQDNMMVYSLCEYQNNLVL